MLIFREKHLPELLAPQESPCVSIYLTTHRTHPDNAQDAKTFKKLVEELAPFKEQYKKDQAVQAIFSRLDELADDYGFWQYTLEGLAVFATRETFHVYRLKRPVQSLAIVADSFHTKPLIKYLQSADRFHVLVLSLDRAQLYEGNRYKIDKVILDEEDEIPSTMIAALDHEMRDLHATLASYRTATGERWDTAQNHGLNKTDIDNDVEQFFRAIDRAITSEYSQPSGLPLVLATLPEHHHLFRRVSQNPLLFEKGIEINAAALEPDEIRKLAWEVFEPHYTEKLNQLVEDYHHAAAKDLGYDKIQQIVKDAHDGKVSALLLEEDRVILGKIVDRDTVKYADTGDGGFNKVDDVLDDLGELVKQFGGDVMVIPSEKMPTTTGAAAINRY